MEGLRPYKFGVKFSTHFAEHLKDTSFCFVGGSNSIGTTIRTEVSPDRKIVRSSLTFPLCWEEVSTGDLRMAIYSAFDREWAYCHSRFRPNIAWFPILDKAMEEAIAKGLPDTRYVGCQFDVSFSLDTWNEKTDFPVTETLWNYIVESFESFRRKVKIEN